MNLKTEFFVISLSKSPNNYSYILYLRFLFFYLKTTFFFDYFGEYYFKIKTFSPALNPLKHLNLGNLRLKATESLDLVLASALISTS